MARKILLADDSVTAQNMGRKILADAGYDVITVNNGSAALKRVSEIKPDLIVLDVYMPGYSGLEVCQRLKDSPETEHIPVLLTVGKLEPFKPEEARRVRADAHIIKPFEASELLTAITKLEDRMVPMQPDGSRFSGSVSGVERFSGDGGKKAAEADTSWKNRLRFPSKKKKEEPEPEPEDAEVANYRDFRKGKGKNAANAPFTVKAPPPPGQEPGLVPDIPRDITPEELDALSALAAKLDGPIPAAENIAPLAEKMGPPAAPAEVTAPSSHVEETKSEVTVSATEVVAETPSEEKKEEIAAKATEAPHAVATPAVAEFVVEAPAAPVEVPVAHSEPAPKAVAEPATAEIAKADDVPSGELPKEVQESETSKTIPVSAASFVEESAPVDRTDEPAFADLAAQAPEAKAEVKTSEPRIDEKRAEAIAGTQTAAVSAAAEPVAAGAEAKQVEGSKVADVKAEELKAEELKAEAQKSENVEPPAAVAAAEPEPQEPSPTDEELAEALRLLTPSAGHAETSSVPSHGTLVAAGQLLAEEVARNASNAPRWVAQPVALSPEEMTLSLEAEMRAFAATAATMSAPSVESMEPPATPSGVSAIAAAVENRLASMELVSPANDLPEQGAAAAEAVTAPSVRAMAGNKVTPFEIASAHEAAQPPQVTPADTDATGDEPKQRNEAAEEAAPVTFADAMGKDETESPAQDSSTVQDQVLVGATAAEVEELQDSSSEVGGQDSMAKAKAGKSNWHQIHTAAPGAGAASKDAVEAAKQAEPVAEEAPKVMAAAAAAEGSNAPAPDAGTIASIVDSVMADLRPKIVEEIAKKLAGK